MIIFTSYDHNYQLLIRKHSLPFMRLQQWEMILLAHLYLINLFETFKKIFYYTLRLSLICVLASVNNHYSCFDVMDHKNIFNFVHYRLS